MSARRGGPYRIDLQNPVPDHPLNRGLVSWWLGLPHLFGGNRLWDLRIKNHGSISGLAFPSTATSGWNPSGAGDGFGTLEFDGTNDTVALTVPALSEGYSLEIVARLRSAGSYPMIIGSSTSGYELLCEDTTRNLYFQAPFGSLTVGLGSSITLALGEWYHIVATNANSAGTASGVLYVNGVSRASNTGSYVNLPTTLYLGSRTGGSFWFPGSIESFRLHQMPLSATQVQSSYVEWKRGFPNLLRRYPERSWFVLRESAAAVGGTTIPVFAHHYRMQGIQ